MTPSWSIFLIMSAACVAYVKSDVFTAYADIAALLGAEKYVASAVDEYIRLEMQRLERIREFAREYEVRNAEALTLGPEFVSNPVNAYMLIKRLTSDWAHVEHLLRHSLADEFLANVTGRRQMAQAKFPNDDDLTGAAVALLRLQDTYRLDTTDIAEGRIQGTKQAQRLTSKDCFELGRTAYNQGDYYHCLMWMQESLNRLQVEQQSYEDVEKPKLKDILEYLSFSLYQQGNVKRALVMTKRLVKMDPDHPRASGNVKWYEDMLKKEGQKVDTAELPPLVNPRGDNSGIPERDDYEALCRGEVTPNPKEDAKLFCYYKRDKPFLWLAPIKVQIMRFNPLAVLFIDVISDDEVEVIKGLAMPKLRRATVHNRDTGQLEFASYRISKSAWLKHYDHPVVARMNRRIEDMTNLKQDTSEELQIANYGLGGHYDPHFDFATIANYGLGGHYDPHYDMSTRGERDPYSDGTGNRIATVLFYEDEKNAFKGLGTGNRIATVLFYMTKPEAGGATVFTGLKTAVFPVKNAALFWYNIHRSGDGDLTTRHAACPVLSGVKWVSNKWIHERGQEFVRPCGLKRSIKEQFVGDLA